MASPVDAMTEAAQGGFIPQDPAELAAIMEGLPGLFEAMNSGLEGLAEWLDEMELVTKTSDHMADLRVSVQAAYEAAQHAAVAFTEECGYWLNR